MNYLPGGAPTVNLSPNKDTAVQVKFNDYHIGSGLRYPNGNLVLKQTFGDFLEQCVQIMPLGWMLRGPRGITSARSPKLNYLSDAQQTTAPQFREPVLPIMPLIHKLPDLSHILPNVLEYQSESESLNTSNDEELSSRRSTQDGSNNQTEIIKLLKGRTESAFVPSRLIEKEANGEVDCQTLLSRELNPIRNRMSGANLMGTVADIKKRKYTSLDEFQLLNKLISQKAFKLRKVPEMLGMPN
jgi:hypothetical protein